MRDPFDHRRVEQSLHRDAEGLEADEHLEGKIAQAQGEGLPSRPGEKSQDECEDEKHSRRGPGVEDAAGAQGRGRGQPEAQHGARRSACAIARGPADGPDDGGAHEKGQ
jgi:hypothetical protein